MNLRKSSFLTPWPCRLFLLTLLAVLAGCFGGSTTVPADHFYRLPVATQPPAGSASSTPLLTGNLAIARFKTSGLLQDRPILYVQSSSPLELKRYYYHQWADTPVNLVQEHMLSYLRSRGVAKGVTRVQSRNNSEFLLGGRLLRLERVEQEGSVTAAVELELALYHHGSLCHQGRYHAGQTTNSNTLEHTISALGLALEQTYDRFLNDLSNRDAC